MKRRLKRNVNKRLAGKCHPKTGVLFVKKDIYCGWGILEDFVGPEFEGVKVDIGLTLEQAYKKLGGTDRKFYNGTMSLGIMCIKEQIENNTLSDNLYLSQEDIDMIKKGKLPQCKTMHHCPETTKEGTIVMQLVDRDIHHKTRHTGGSATLNIENSYAVSDDFE